ncbi:S-layer homology domain-containing protein [Candidatus Margulisiibacteriota bacterium]
MRKLLVLLLLSLLFAAEALAGIHIYEPTDKLITFDSVIMLRGLGRDLDILKINDQRFKFNPDGSFACGLVLKRGKNYVEVRALDKNKGHFVKKLRILSLQIYPDIETLYEGKKHWARSQIIHLSSLGLIEGYPDGNFYPANPVTRGELATWLARIKRLRLEALTEDVFFDVPKEHWRAPYIKAAVKAGYMTGYDESTFGVDDPISRREAAQVATVTEGLAVVEKIKQIFIDVPRQEKGALPIYVGRQKGLLKGVYADIPVYDPDRALTRAEAAILLSRFERSQNSIRYLFNFNQGFSAGSYCGLNVAPVVTDFRVEPPSVRFKEKAVVRLRAEIAPRQGFVPISRVKVDLTEIGGMPDTEMFDDGAHGDEQGNDGVYSLNLSIQPEVSGAKSLWLKATDRLGWEGVRETSLLILE